jgi:dTDP-glucose pyrophosphorylase
VTFNKEVWSQAIMQVNSSIQDAAIVLNETSLKIVMVTDDHGKLIGTISDGDIRRGLLRGLDLSSPIESIVHEDPVVVPPEMTVEEVATLMKANKIQQIPIVNHELRVVGLHLWDELNSRPSRPNLMIIMAGGKGTRLYPKTENCPKPMLPIAGKPILEHIIERAKIQGFTRFILAIHHLGHVIEDYFGTGDSLGVQIGYLREQSPLGTAGALSLLSPVPISAFVVTNGDVITDVPYGDLIDFHEEHTAVATMSVRAHEWQNPFGVVQIDGMQIAGYEEKPVFRSLINAGVYVLEPDALKYLKKSTVCDMPTLFDLLRQNNEKVIAYPIHEGWLDIGLPEELQKAVELERSRTINTKRYEV